MLSAADHQLIRREPDMPGMGSVLDNCALIELLERHGYASIDFLSSDYLRYKPNANCLVAGKAELGGVTTHWYAVAYHNDVAKDKLSSADRWLSKTGGCGFVDADVQIAAFGFPSDLRLAQLAEVHDADKLATLVRAKPVSHEVLSYKPHRRCVTRVDVDGTPRAVLRCLLSNHYLQAKRVAKHVPQLDSIQRPELTDHSDRHSVLVTRWVPGISLSEFEGEEAVHQVYRTGTALAELHTHHEPKLAFAAAGSQLAQLGQAVEMVQRLLPDQSGRLRSVAATLTARIARQVRRCVFLHGDFHADQVIVSDQLAFLDWDRAQNGDPESDLASFLAHERVRLAVVDRAADWEPMRRALIDGYQTVGEVNLHRLDTYLALELVKASVLPFRRRQTDWPAKMQAVLDVVVELTADKPRGIRADQMLTPISVPSTVCADETIVDEWLRPALDRQVAEQAIAVNLVGPDQLELNDVEIMQHKPGRRALLRYHLTTANGNRSCLLGKVRAKGTDMRSADIQARLYDRIRERGSLVLGVPRPLGVIAGLQMWLQEFVPGATAAQLIKPGSDSRLACRLAAALAELHQLELTVPREHTRADELAILRKRLTRVADKRPELASNVLLVLQLCEQLLDRFPGQLTSGIHRDFYPAQVICGPDRLTFVDFDLFAMGDPLVDVGNFLAHVREAAIREHGQAAALAVHEHAFAQTYVAAMGGVSLEAIQAHTIVALARHIHISWAMLARQHATEAILSECLQLCTAMNQHVTST